jgi:4-hydroxy 2-oxovalerate aldolase
MALRIIDCTLRDGGYYNNWSFPRALVADHLRAMHSAAIDVVEIGFRNFPQPTFLGPYAYSLDSFLERLDVPTALRLGVMVDAKTVLGGHRDPIAAVDALFPSRASSCVEWVRIAAHLSEVEACEPVASRLRALGYRVGLNMMQIAGASSDRIGALARCATTWDSLEVLYFADSFGSMDRTGVERVIEAIRTGWSGPIGIHTHNNKALAVQNTLAAIEHGAEYVDATVSGMGRGAGNAELEILLCELESRGLRASRLDELAALLVDWFQPMKERYGWGAGFFYHYSALHNIHPMFAQTLMADERYSAWEKFSALRSLAARNSTSFTRGEFERSLHSFRDDRPLDADARATDLSAFAGAEVLLVGAGPSVREYEDDIDLFIRGHRPLVLTLNHQAAIAEDLVDGIICVDEYRLLNEAEFLASCGKPVYSARRHQDAETRRKLAGADCREYDCVLQPGRFEALPYGCVIPVPLAFAYALALCIAGRARKVFLVGFDGFSANDSRQTEMLDLLRIVAPHFGEMALTALTPTNYPVPQGSIYADYR